MTSDKPSLLFCAGEDSGDCIGESLVRFAQEKYGEKLRLLGAGGRRMVSAGLSAVVEFDDLPVSGFGDVLPRYFRLRKSFNVLKRILMKPECKGLVAIDYPGFNMKLVALANRLKKPVLYVAPPQVWAWKSHRAQKLKSPENLLACFYDFEERTYKSAGCNVVQMQHPFALHRDMEQLQNKAGKEEILLFPGSREGQAVRNISFFLKVIERLKSEIHSIETLSSFPDVVVMVPRLPVKTAVESQMVKFFKGSIPKGFSVEFVPQDFPSRKKRFERALCALSIPGTVSLELALSGCNAVICTVPDRLTYAVGKRLVKTDFFALPSLILGQEIYKEHLVPNASCKYACEVSANLKRCLQSPLNVEIPGKLKERLMVGKSSEQLMSEFLAKLV